MEFWQVYLGLSLLAAIFVLWPTLFVGKKQKKALLEHTHADSNEEVFQQHFEDLERTRTRGEIDAEEYDELKQDLERTLVEENNNSYLNSEQPIISTFKSRLPLLGLLFVLPISVLLIYRFVGAKDDWQIYELAIQKNSSVIEDERRELGGELVQSLQERLREKPLNTQNWYLLATTSIEMGDFEEGVRAFRELLKVEPNAPEVKAELAQALFLRAGNTITPEVRQQTQEALEMQPEMPTALGLAGIDAYQSGDYTVAIDYWQKAVAQLDPNSQSAKVLNAGISRAEMALAKTGDGQKETPKSQGLSLKVEVSVAKDLQLNPEDLVFVYARAWQGPKMPLAIQRVRVSDLPETITLDQTMAMTQGMDLSSFPQVEIVARVSSTGSAVSTSGDWQASHGPVLVASQKKTLKLEIKEQLQ
ncbi:Formate-dependent nitrite reductase complex subunit NrfG [Thalassocella blandensis]|nr:Formate-dependent nitrite reductase complex subunit NrfG [Thalassocella blandensis]